MHKLPSKPNTINPKLAAIAVKLDKATAHWRHLKAKAPGEDVDYSTIWRLEDKLARATATNIEELKLKARYTEDLDWSNIQDPVAKSIIRDLLAMDRKPEPIASKRTAAGGVGTGG